MRTSFMQVVISNSVQAVQVLWFAVSVANHAALERVSFHMQSPECLAPVQEKLERRKQVILSSGVKLGTAN